MKTVKKVVKKRIRSEPRARRAFETASGPTAKGAGRRNGAIGSGMLLLLGIPVAISALCGLEIMLGKVSESSKHTVEVPLEAAKDGAKTKEPSARTVDPKHVPPAPTSYN